MNINADDAKRVVINHHDLPWVPSPESGVDRRMLERTGDEVAKATSIVRYQAGSKLQTHAHEFGEEILAAGFRLKAMDTEGPQARGGSL